ncbi:MAG: ParA family protein [Gammaproteobacteria bacterium]|nr:ParA family protein [Gammaproteobacteria bacterium]
MARIHAITNQKGGVGKTTTSVNLAASLAATRRRVLLVDLDPQGNATMGSGVDKRNIVLSSFDVLMENATLAQARITLPDVGYDLLPANADLTGAEVGLLEEYGRELRLRNALATVEDQYDFILIDCPPSLNMLTVNALVAAEAVIIPTQCEYFALEGLSALLETVEKIKKYLNPELKVEGFLRTMYDPRNNLATQVSQQLIQHFGEKVYRTVIPRNVRLAEAPSHGLPALLYDKASSGALAYLALAGEMLRRAEASAA